MLVSCQILISFFLKLNMSTIHGDPWKDNIERSCVVLYFHFFWGLSMIILGWTAFAARWFDRLRAYHRTMGQAWIYGMIVQVYTATYCRRDGFRWFIFMFGVICYSSLIIGHAIIRKYQKERQLIQLHTKQQCNSESDAKLVSDHSQEIDTRHIANGLVDENSIHSTFLQFNFDFSLRLMRILHGVCMVVSMAMTTGAGAAFTKRFSDVNGCYNIYSSS